MSLQYFVNCRGCTLLWHSVSTCLMSYLSPTVSEHHAGGQLTSSLFYCRYCRNDEIHAVAAETTRCCCIYWVCRQLFVSLFHLILIAGKLHASSKFFMKHPWECYIKYIAGMGLKTIWSRPRQGVFEVKHKQESLANANVKRATAVRV